MGRSSPLRRLFSSRRPSKRRRQRRNRRPLFEPLEDRRVLSFILQIDDPSTPGVDRTIVDNGAGDTLPDVGTIGFRGAIGRFSVVHATAISKPQIGPGRIDLGGVAFGGPGTLDFRATDTGYQTLTQDPARAAPHVLISRIGGMTAGSVTFVNQVDLANNPFATGPPPPIIYTAGPQGPFGPGSFSDERNLPFDVPTADPFSLHDVVRVVHSRQFQSTSFNAESRVDKLSNSECSCDCCGEEFGSANDNGGSSVYLHNGEFHHERMFNRIPGVGLDWEFSIAYRSDVSFTGTLGHNWELNYNRRLIGTNAGGDILRTDGMNRADSYRRQPDGSFTAPNGFYTRLTANPDGSFTERNRDGTEFTYTPLSNSGIALMSSMQDRNGNAMRFERNAQGQLVRVIDTMGRPIDYSYDVFGRLVEVRDFFDRAIRLEYDGNNDLAAVTTPAVTGTPTGNDFPGGKTERYTYTSGFADQRLNHRLLSITAPNEVAAAGPPRVQVTYDLNPASPHLGRVLSQTVGGTNASDVPAGGTISYQYDTTFPPVGPGDFDSPVLQNTVTDRNGNPTEYRFNRLGNILRTREFTNRDIRLGDPDFFETVQQWNGDYENLESINPEGNTIQNVFDESNPDRFQQGNLLSSTRLPDAARGGDQDRITTRYTYEPIYNQVRTTTDPRGNGPDFRPPLELPGEIFPNPERYTTTSTFDYQEGTDFAGLADRLGVTVAEVTALLTAAGSAMGLGDVNGDGRTDQIAGNVIRIDYPTVDLVTGSNQAAVEGDTEQEIFELFVYNDFGQLTQVTDAEGNVDRYDYFPQRDPDGDGVINNPSGDATTGGYLRQITRDTVSDPGRNSGTNPSPTHIRTVYQYDPVGNVTREIDGRGIATDFAVNQLNQVVQITRSAAHGLYPSQDMDGFPPDPIEPLPLLDFRYVERYFYDFNDNVVLRQVEDRGNTSSVDGNPSAVDLPDVPGGADPDPAGGTAFVATIYKYDILDNQIELLEEVANGVAAEFLRTRYRYDPNENQVLTILPEGNATSAIYDERDLLFRSIRGPLEPPELGHGAPAGTAPTLLGPGDPTDYDARGGILCACSTFRYDGNRNTIESVDSDDTDGSPDNNSDLGPGDRTRYIYDGFDRQTSVIDAVGNQTVYQYDPAGNMVRLSRFGPVSGPSPTSDGGPLAGPVSSLGEIQSANLVSDNLLEATEYLYDELSRTFQTDRVLFINTIPTVRTPDVADGAADIGSGNLTPGDDQPIPGVSGVTILGRVSSRTEYDRNSRTTFSVEDDEDTSRYFYDGAHRVIRTEDPEGNVTQTAYDDNHNVIEVREEDVAQAAIASEEFFTTYFYDSLDRLERTVDNLGQAMFYRYDSRNNLVAMADAQGPLTGATIERRAFAPCLGPACINQTVDEINDFGNVTRYFYDGISRQTRQEVILTEIPPDPVRPATASGDGVHVGASIFGVKDDPAAPESFTPTPDASQGGGDGILRTGYTYDQNSLLSALVDDNGNVTVYLYDNLNRRVTETKGLTVATTLDNATILGPRIVPTLTAGTVPDGEIDSPDDFTGDASLLTFKSLSAGDEVTGFGGVDFELVGLARGPQAQFDAVTPREFGPDEQTMLSNAFAGSSPPFADLLVSFPAPVSRVGFEARTEPADDIDVTLLLSGSVVDAFTLTMQGLTEFFFYGFETIVPFDQMILDAQETASGLLELDNLRFELTFIPPGQIDTQLAAAESRLDAIAALFPPLADRVDDMPPTAIVYGYAPDDNLLILEDENDNEVFTRYDAINRPIAVRVFRAGQTDDHSADSIFAPIPLHDPSNPSTPTTVAGTHIQDYQYDGLWRLVQGTDNNDPLDAADDSRITYAYDSLSRVIEETQQIGALSAKAISSAWRAEDLRSALTYPNDRQVEYTYDGLDRLQTVADAGAAEPIADYDYIGAYRVLVRAHQNDTRMTYLNDAGTADVGYDGLRRPVQLRHLRDANTLIVGFTYTYDRMNNKLDEGKLHDPANSEIYTYDSAYRLIDFARPDAGAIDPLHSDWQLDGVGNWQQVTSTESGAPVPETREHSSFNELTRREDGPPIDLSYDDNGNQTDDGTFTFAWDYRNRLRTVVRNSDGTTIAVYSYDAPGRRIRTAVSNSGALDGTTDFYLDGWQEIEERGATDTLTQQYVHGIYIDEPLVIDRNLDADATATGAGDQRLFYHQNTLYSVYALTDDAATIVEGYQYDAYGRQTVYEPGPNGAVDFGGDDSITSGGNSAINHSYFYTGRRFDAESGVYYYRERYYSQSLGRFLSRDPRGYVDGVGLYQYVHNNPLKSTDPLGLKTTDVYHMNQGFPKENSSDKVNTCLRIDGGLKCAIIWAKWKDVEFTVTRTKSGNVVGDFLIDVGAVTAGVGGAVATVGAITAAWSALSTPATGPGGVAGAVSGSSVVVVGGIVIGVGGVAAGAGGLINWFSADQISLHTRKGWLDLVHVYEIRAGQCDKACATIIGRTSIEFEPHCNLEQAKWGEEGWYNNLP